MVTFFVTGAVYGWKSEDPGQRFQAQGPSNRYCLRYTEKNNLGFYLWRTEAGQDAYTRLTRDLITARGSASMGASYSYADYAVARGREYLYKLEDVDRHGGSTFHGPVSAPAGGGKKSKDNRTQ